MRLRFVFLVTAASASWAHVLDGHGREGAGVHVYSHDRRSHDLYHPLELFPASEKRQNSRGKCSPPVFTGNTRRDWGEIDRPWPNVTIAKRTMTVPEDDTPQAIERFMLGEINPDPLPSDYDYNPIIWEDRTKDGEVTDIATARDQKFEENAFSWGTGGICGCTVMVLISRKGVYVAHYWESVSFNPDKRWLEHYGTKEACFQKTVVTGLKKGVKGRKKTDPEQVSLTYFSERLVDEHIRGYLMIPSEDNDGAEDAYRNRWNEIKQVVGGMIPKLAENNRWTEVKYMALNEDDEDLKYKANGKVLFKYDPNTDGKRKAMLWIESTEIDSDSWER
ncbi:hypothetical protein K402DRAFT_454866 [Aulographum hederae CBS 113979]|uniref:ADP-ribosylation n=1 Tax=Aulographum hederae CBS 113979 TaxID=1176131 RepID=A0A6G1GXL3_9PEZI|nr:hypothetical protein K402DRAFT_454866 [Aulographum hederae CBS 113979]